MIRFNKLYSTVWILTICCQAAPSLDGTSSLVYQPFHQVFNAAGGAQSKVQGFVRLGKGFTILPDASAIFDTFMTVSGPIDLRETGTLILNSSLSLGSNVTLSSGGVIHGYGNSIILRGDLAIPSRKIIHIKSDTIIDGRGHTLTVGDYGQLFIDNSVTLTLQNMVLKSGPKTTALPPFRCASSGSQLALDNVVLVPSADIPFYQGKLYAHNDVVFTGTSALIYNSPQISFVRSGATLVFDTSTTFSFAPASTAKDLICLQDASSKLVFDGASLKCTETGLRLTGGMLQCNNKMSMDSLSGFSFSSLVTLTGGYYRIYNAYTVKCRWSADGNYFAVAGDGGFSARIYAFNKADCSITQIDTAPFASPFIYALDWSNDGRYLAMGGPTGSNVMVYSFDGSTFTQVVNIGSIAFWPYCVAWSPDSSYLAVAGSDGPRIYRFNGATLISVTMVSYGSQVNYMAWHPRGNYLAVGGSGGSVVVYSFDGSSLSNIASCVYGAAVNKVDWSPDGRCLAFGGESVNSADSPIAATDPLRIYSFSGSALVPIVGKSTGTTVNSLKWSPDGKMLAVGGNNNVVKTYVFNGNTLDLSVSTTLSPEGVRSVDCAWHPQGNFLCVAQGDGTAEYFSILRFGRVPTFNQSARNSLIFGSVIRNAWYGDPNHSLRRYDVTMIVNDNIRQNSGGLNITANNATFGDPIVGVAKQLMITFVGGGTVSCNENATITKTADEVTALAGSASNLKVKILSGTYVEIRGQAVEDSV